MCKKRFVAIGLLALATLFSVAGWGSCAERLSAEAIALAACDGVGVVEVVTVQQASLKIGEDSLGTIPAGTRLTVEKARDNWLGVRPQIGGKSTFGWVHTRDVGSNGTKGAPILLMEEVHTSRAGQIQHVITLVRLRERPGLQAIALEGYLKERPALSTDWYVQAAGGDKLRRARVAARLLKEGEISCAEFMALTYQDVALRPIETTSQYTVEMPKEAAVAPLGHLVKIAERSLTQSHAARLQQLNSEIERLQGEGRQKKVKELLDYILSVDSWVDGKAKALRDPNVARNFTAEEQFARMEEIVERAKKLSVELSPDERQGMEKNLAFWRGRIAASRTMVDAVAPLADQPGAEVVPMIIGAAHTRGMCAMLRQAGRPFAVVTPLALKKAEEAGDLTFEMFERKYQRKSVFTEGFMELLSSAFKKPEPVLAQAWFQAKSELYLFVDRIARGILGPPAPPNGGKPPYGFADDDFKGRFVRIDPRRIELVPDTQDGKGRAVLIPAALNPDDPAKRKQIWVKACLNMALGQEPSSLEREHVEGMLRKALQEVQAEKETQKKAEDEKGRVQITQHVRAAINASKEAAQAVILGGI